MVSFEEIREFTLNEILPAVTTDGGDLRAIALEGETVTFGAYAECAVCPACNDDYIWWLSNKLKTRFGFDFKVKIEKYPAYYGG